MPPRRGSVSYTHLDVYKRQAIHGGYTADATRAVAVPIYQTVAHDFVSAEHAGAVFDLEVPG